MLNYQGVEEALRIINYSTIFNMVVHNIAKRIEKIRKYPSRLVLRTSGGFHVNNKMKRGNLKGGTDHQDEHNH